MRGLGIWIWLFWEIPSLVFPYSAIPWLYSGYSTCVSRRCFWLLFHTFRVKVDSDPEVDSRTVFGVSTNPSYAAVTVPVSVPRELYRILWIYWEMTSGFFPFSWYASFDGVDACVSLRCFAAPCSGSHLFGAVCSSGALENADFLGDDIPGYFRIQRLFARQWIHVLRQFSRRWYFTHFLREGVIVYAQCSVLLGQGC